MQTFVFAIEFVFVYLYLTFCQVSANKWFLPLVWATDICARALAEGHIRPQVGMLTINTEEIVTIMTTMNNLTAKIITQAGIMEYLHV